MAKKFFTTVLKIFIIIVGSLLCGINGLILVSSEEFNVTTIVIWFCIGTIGGAVTANMCGNFTDILQLKKDFRYSFCVMLGINTLFLGMSMIFQYARNISFHSIWKLIIGIVLAVIPFVVLVIWGNKPIEMQEINESSKD